MNNSVGIDCLTTSWFMLPIPSLLFLSYIFETGHLAVNAKEKPKYLILNGFHNQGLFREGASAGSRHVAFFLRLCPRCLFCQKVTHTCPTAVHLLNFCSLKRWNRSPRGYLSGIHVRRDEAALWRAVGSWNTGCHPQHCPESLRPHGFSVLV